MFFNRSKGSPSWLVAFLGNPGPNYEHSRHNAGFMAARALEESKNIKINRLKFNALTALADLGGQKVFLIKPQTFMNLSGNAVISAARFYKLPPERILVVFDDTSIELGKLRIKRNGSDGGHNGIKSIISCLGSSDFPRIKIGVGAPPHPDHDMISWVLGKPDGNDMKALLASAKKAAEAAEELILNGIDPAMNKYNS